MLWTHYNLCKSIDMHIHFIGAEHAIEFMCCSCEPLAVTMARARLWPATPYNPRICFTFDLLDWAEALMLECQVSLKDFCASLCFKCPYLFEKVHHNN